MGDAPTHKSAQATLTTSRERSGLIAVVLFAGACSAAKTVPAAIVPTTATPPSRPPATVAAEREVIAVAHEMGTPLRPPSVSMIAGSAAGDVEQHGVLLSGAFITKHSSFSQESHAPVPWPEPSKVADASEGTLVLDTEIFPAYLLVKNYLAVDPGTLDSRGMPTASSGCNRDFAPRCRFVKTASGIEVLGIDRSVFAGGYQELTIVWNVPPAEARPEPYNKTTAGVWIFRITDSDVAP